MMLGVVSLILAIITLVAYFAGAGTGVCLFVGGVRLVIDLIGMAVGALKPPVPVIAYIIGAVLVQPWYLGVVIGGAFANLVEIPGLLMAMGGKSARAEDYPFDGSE